MLGKFWLRIFILHPGTLTPRAEARECRSMANVNRNMFDASIITDRPGGASLMVLPLNLIVQIVSNVSLP